MESCEIMRQHFSKSIWFEEVLRKHSQLKNNGKKKFESSTSLSGGNQIDGLPPASSYFQIGIAINIIGLTIVLVLSKNMQFVF